MWIGIAISVSITGCCCLIILVFCAFNFMDKSRPSLPSAPPMRAAGPRVKSSRRAVEEEGVSMSNLLSAEDIEDHMIEIRSPDLSSDEEPQTKKQTKISVKNNIV